MLSGKEKGTNTPGKGSGQFLEQKGGQCGWCVVGKGEVGQDGRGEGESDNPVPWPSGEGVVEGPRAQVDWVCHLLAV